MKPIKGRRKASKFKPKDYISNMPDNVVTHILNRLPLQDAVRTGILSREWRFKWTMLSELVFDEDFFEYVTEREGDENYGRFISRLLGHFKSAITKSYIYLLDESYEIEQWILFLSKKGVKDLTIIKWTDEPLKLPTHLYSCLELKHLNLDNCYFDPPASFHGFPNLLSLELFQVDFERGKLCEFFTPCPLLQILKMGTNICDDKVKIVEIAKLTNLKILTLFINNLDDTEVTSSSSIFELVGFLPKLQELHLDFEECEAFTEYDARNRSPSTFPCLKRLKLSNIDLGSGIVLSFAFEIIWSSPNLQTLEIIAGASDVDLPAAILSAESFTKDGARNRSHTTFPCLKTLILSKIDLGSGIVLSFAFEIIRSSPNLQTIEITAGASDVDLPAAILSPEYFIEDGATKRSPTTSPFLKAIKLPLVSGIMLSFASKIIRGSPSLQTLEIIVGDWDDDSPPTICSPEVDSKSFKKGRARKRTPTTFPCLETLKLSNMDLGSGIMISFAFQMITSSPSLQTLEITSGVMSCNKDGARKRSRGTFPCLKTLKLLEIDLDSGTVLSFAFDIIRSSSNLRTLEITAGDWGVESSRAICSPEVDYNATEMLQLRSVVFRDLKGTKNEICWIKYLLACSPFLERIHIRLRPRLACNQKYKFARKLLKLHRASPVADIDLY